jgi:glucosamine--fructose-6-phosphate aminotransferase (isomerizing)
MSRSAKPLDLPLENSVALPISTSIVEKIEQIQILACGTSRHAGMVGAYLLEQFAGVPTKVYFASEFRYAPPPVSPNTLTIGVSQSGETADTLAAIRKAREKGAMTLGIVNVVGSSIARETHCGVYIHAGPEIGVASTKAFTSQVTIFNLIGILLAQKKGVKKEKLQTLINDLEKLPSLVQSVIDNGNDIMSISQDFIDVENFLYLGRGYQFPVALEGALKLKEISYIHAMGPCFISAAGYPSAWI